MPVIIVGWVHFVLALLALLAGALVTGMEKGGPRHRRLGRVYGGLMAGVNLTAFALYGLFGTFGPFHVAAVASLVTVLAGWWVAWRRPARSWLPAHAHWMSWSYVGLLAAAAAETLSRLPESPFWVMVGAASAGVILVGGVVIARTVPAAVSRRQSGT